MVSATRHKRQMYAVKGSNGELDCKIGQSEFPEKIFLEENGNRLIHLGLVAETV